MKDYLYISERKLKSYEAQIAPGLAKSIDAEIGASIGVLSAKLRTRDPSKDKAARVELVSEFIEKHYSVGSLGVHIANRDWIKGQLLVNSVTIPGLPEVMFLVGKHDNDEVFAIIGSAAHVLGNENMPQEYTRFTASYFHAFIEAIGQAQEDVSSRLRDEDLLGKDERIILGNSNQEVAAILNRFCWDAEGHKFAVRFLGRSVFRGTATGHPPTNAVTPLWIELI